MNIIKFLFLNLIRPFKSSIFLGSLLASTFLFLYNYLINQWPTLLCMLVSILCFIICILTNLCVAMIDYDSLSKDQKITRLTLFFSFLLVITSGLNSSYILNEPINDNTPKISSINTNNTGLDLDDRISQLIKQQDILFKKFNDIQYSIASSNNHKLEIYDLWDHLLKNPLISQEYSMIEWFNRWKELIALMDITQLVAFTNLSGLVFILMCFYSLIMVFIGNSIINYFNIEEKWPRMKKYMDLRLKFRNYYLIVDSVLILITISVLVTINLYTLIG